MNEPAGLGRLRGASGRPGPRAPLDPRLGAWARALAAAKPGGALLHVCESSDEMALWIRSGMDLGSRLVVVMPQRGGGGALEAVLGADLQVTCHHQAPDDFLDDVRAHRFGLIVHDGWPEGVGRIDRLWEVLAPGGLLFVAGLDTGSEALGAAAAAGAIARRDDAAVARHAGVDGALVAARVTPAPSPARRGGRRARRGPGAVTALHPPA